MGSRYLLRRILQAILTIAAIVLLNFVLFRMMPGSPDRLSRNPNASNEARAALRARWGLDKPLFPDQFVAYLEATAQGDFGAVVQVQGPGRHGRHRRPGLADDHPVRPGRADRDRRRARPRRVQRLETRRRGRLRRQRHLAHPLFDAVLPVRDDPPGHLRDRARLVPDVRHVRAGQDLHVVRGPAPRLRTPPRPAAGRGQPRADRPVLHPHALVGHRDARRGLRDDGQGQGPPRVPGPARPRGPERPAADGLAHRHQPRLHHRRRDHGRGRVQLARPRDAHPGGARGARLPGAPGASS